MVVLKNVDRKTRLFWVLEAIGISLGVALLAIADVDRTSHAGSCSLRTPVMCRIYGYYLTLDLHPIAVTVCSIYCSRLVNCHGFTMPSDCLERAKLLVVGCAWVVISFLRIWRLNVLVHKDTEIIVFDFQNIILAFVCETMLFSCMAVYVLVNAVCIGRAERWLQADLRALRRDPCVKRTMCLGVTLLTIVIISRAPVWWDIPD